MASSRRPPASIARVNCTPSRRRSDRLRRAGALIAEREDLAAATATRRRDRRQLTSRARAEQGTCPGVVEGTALLGSGIALHLAGKPRHQCRGGGGLGPTLGRPSLAIGKDFEPLLAGGSRRAGRLGSRVGDGGVGCLGRHQHAVECGLGAAGKRSGHIDPADPHTETGTLLRQHVETPVGLAHQIGAERFPAGTTRAGGAGSGDEDRVERAGCTNGDRTRGEDPVEGGRHVLFCQQIGLRVVDLVEQCRLQVDDPGLAGKQKRRVAARVGTDLELRRLTGEGDRRAVETMHRLCDLPVRSWQQYNLLDRLGPGEQQAGPLEFG